uniref:Uncharacterized protein n=1 Tax=Romanomermis culicivorax TaxID=13658 RepID=A0A915L3S6_ROMCU
MLADIEHITPIAPVAAAEDDEMNVSDKTLYNIPDETMIDNESTTKLAANPSIYLATHQQSKDLAMALATYGFLAPLVNMLPWEDHCQDYPSILCNCILEILMPALNTQTQMTPTIFHLLL